MSIFLIISVVINVIFIYFIVNMNFKLLKLQGIVNTIQGIESMTYHLVTQLLSKFNRINEDLKRIDHLGAFKSDDEVGYIFKAIQEAIDILADLLLTVKLEFENIGESESEGK